VDSAPSVSIDSWKNFFLTAGFGESAANFYVDLFQKHEVDLDMLAEINHEVLTQMGIWKAGHRIRILRMRRFLFNFEAGKRSYFALVLVYTVVSLTSRVFIAHRVLN
jgi:hypothetical protein